MLSPAESEKVLQEASLRVWMILDTLDINAIKPYWYRVARNVDPAKQNYWLLFCVFGQTIHENRVRTRLHDTSRSAKKAALRTGGRLASTSVNERLI